MCIHICVCARVCVLMSVPLCFASVQKGLVPTTWCRAASAPPIPAWIATLAANQKLPAAFAVCPLSIFSNTSLNLLASLGCCIKPPPHPPIPTCFYIISFSCLRSVNSSGAPLHASEWQTLNSRVTLHVRGQQPFCCILKAENVISLRMIAADLRAHPVFNADSGAVKIYLMHKCPLCLL